MTWSTLSTLQDLPRLLVASRFAPYRQVTRGAGLALCTAIVLAGCGDTPRESRPTTEDAPTATAVARQAAQRYLEALVSDTPCDAVWQLVVSDGEDQGDFCKGLAEYRSEVRSLTLGEVTDSSQDYAIFRVRVDYLDGSAPVTDSEIEIDRVDGEFRAAAGLP